MNFHYILLFILIFIFHGHPDGTKAGATAMRQAVDASLKGIPLKIYAKTHGELRKALEKWD